MSGGDEMPEDALDALAAGVYSSTDAEARELAAEVHRDLAVAHRAHRAGPLVAARQEVFDLRHESTGEPGAGAGLDAGREGLG